MDVWEYFESRRREISDASLDPGDLELIALEGSDGQRGRVWGRIGLTERTFLQVSERVVVTGSGVHREEYAYYLIIDGLAVWGQERDPTHDPAVHRHDRNHNRKSVRADHLQGRPCLGLGDRRGGGLVGAYGVALYVACGLTTARRPRSYTQKLWTGLRRKAAYLPG